MLLITDLRAVDFCVLGFSSKSYSSLCAIKFNIMVQLSQLTAIPPSQTLMRGWDYAVSVRFSGARNKTMIRLLYEQ
jgi:hypothetical protein